MQKTSYSIHCIECGHEIRAIARLESVTCNSCHTKNTHLDPRAWDVEMDDSDEAFDPVRDKYMSLQDVWRSNVSRVFNINMRLDKANPGGSNVGGVNPASFKTYGKYKKKSDKNAHVASVKGGRQGAGLVMGWSAYDASKRGVKGRDRQGEEWLHLWGDNLGGPSIVANFVAGSYAANTEMLVIEQALAENLDKTKGVKLKITAYCSTQDVGECVKYKVVNPGKGPDFVHYIDLTNRYFTAIDAKTVQGLIEPWLKANGLLV